MIHIYTGNGKGKTTAALGLALRALGANKKVCILQFLKDGKSSEIKVIRKIKNCQIKSFGRKGFLNKNNLRQKDFDLASQGFNFFKKAIQSKKYDYILLDEVNLACDFNLIQTKDLIHFLKKIPKKTEIILTGRKVDKKLIQIADLVTEMKEIKHYYKKGMQARKGIEY